MAFVIRQFHNEQTLGEKLRALRRGQAVTLEMMTKKTLIRASYLRALERGEYNHLPEPLYARNFIRSYTRTLGADEEYFLELYEEECGQCDLVAPMQTPRQKIRSGRLRIWHKIGVYSAMSLVLLGFSTYLGLQVHSIVTAPEVIIFSPSEATQIGNGVPQ